MESASVKGDKQLTSSNFSKSTFLISELENNLVNVTISPCCPVIEEMLSKEPGADFKNTSTWIWLPKTLFTALANADAVAIQTPKRDSLYPLHSTLLSILPLPSTNIQTVKSPVLVLVKLVNTASLNGVW